MDVIIRPRLADLQKQYSSVCVPDDLARLAAAATLCLWGDPGSGAQGMFFLTEATRQRFKGVMQLPNARRLTGPDRGLVAWPGRRSRSSTPVVYSGRQNGSSRRLTRWRSNDSGSNASPKASTSSSCSGSSVR